jgi:thioredoxin reductase (NADPH)
VIVARDGEVRRLPVDAAFADLSLVPNSAIVRSIAQTDQDGFIWVDERNATTQPDLFAAGDVTTAFGEQVLIAIGDGARAALSAYDYLLPQLRVYDTRPID